MTHIESQVRNILKCKFVERLVISNHNPDIRIEEKVKIKDPRIVMINQPVKRGCGYRWLVANQFQPKYLIVIDDDIWLFPLQIAKLFKHLVAEPDVPHGITGMVRMEDSKIAVVEKKDLTVDYLCETYAITESQLRRYLVLRECLLQDKRLLEMIDAAVDFMLISQSGTQRPKIHNIGRVFKDPSFNQVGVAVHKERDFEDNLFEVNQAMNRFGEFDFIHPCSPS